MKIVVATNNAGKLAELRGLLPASVVLLTLADIGATPPDETGATFTANALLKARSAARSGLIAIADDSGLEVDALSASPGVYSARYAGPLATDDDNNTLLLERMANVPDSKRRARFVSAVAVVTPDGTERAAIGTLKGVIIESPRGSGGFGYDPLFQIDDEDAGDLNGRTLAELSPAEKNAVSHRSRAYKALSSTIDEVVHNHGNCGSER